MNANIQFPASTQIAAEFDGSLDQPAEQTDPPGFPLVGGASSQGRGLGGGGLEAERWVFGRRSNLEQKGKQECCESGKPSESPAGASAVNAEAPAAAAAVPGAGAISGICRRVNITESSSLFLASLLS